MSYFGATAPNSYNICEHTVYRLGAGANLGHDNQFLTRQLQFLDRFAEHDLRESIRVHL